MNAIMYLYGRSFRNTILEGIRSPKRLIRTLGLALILVLFVAGAVSGVVMEAAPTETPLFVGILFALYLIPFFVGRYGGIGPFTSEQVNFIFTAPILPRTVLLAEILRRFWDMFVISLAIVTVIAFMGLTVAMEIRYILLAWAFCMALAVVCKLFGMFLFVTYKRVYHWIGLFWIVLLLLAGVFYFARAGWETMPGMLDFLGSRVFALTPLVGWAAAGAVGFMTGDVFAGALYAGLLMAAGGFFFRGVYKSSPDFYDEAIGMPGITAVADKAEPLIPPPVAQSVTPPNQAASKASNVVIKPVAELPRHTVIARSEATKQSSTREGATSQGLSASGQTTQPSFQGEGAAVFFDKHLIEESGGWSSRTRIPWLRNTRAGAITGVIGIGIFAGMAFAILWGLYARGLAGDIEQVASLFRTIGVPSGNILAILIPSVLILALYPQYDMGFMELYNPYFYLVPDSPMRKLIWVSMARFAKICAVAGLVLVPAGVISGTSPAAVLATVLAYFASAFMILSLRLAIVRFLGIVPDKRQKLVATLPVMLFIFVGMVGMLAVFYFAPERWGLVVALLGFTGWCSLIGVLGLWFSLRVLHDVDAPV